MHQTNAFIVAMNAVAPSPDTDGKEQNVPKQNLPDDKVKGEDEHYVLKFLKQLGTLLTSGALVGTFGKLFGLSDPHVAALTLSLIALLYILIHRKAIQRRLKSSTVLVIVSMTVVLAVLFSSPLVGMMLNQTISKATGIVEYNAKANDFLPRMRDYIGTSQEEIWFTGVSFYITLPANRDALLKKLEEGVTVRFLVYNPHSANIQEVASGFSQSKQELASECDVTIQNLRTLWDEARRRQTKGTLEVRLFSTIPKARMYVFDRRRETGFTYFIPHIDQQNSPNLPGFLVRNIKTGIAPAYFEGIERLWNSSLTFDAFLSMYDTRPATETRPVT